MIRLRKATRKAVDFATRATVALQQNQSSKFMYVLRTLNAIMGDMFAIVAISSHTI